MDDKQLPFPIAEKVTEMWPFFMQSYGGPHQD
jgi:hypothetical protein